MKNKKTIEFLIFFTAILLILNQSVVFAKTNVSTPDSTVLVAHSPVEIKSDQDFVDLGLPGSGTKEDPYIIENYEIDVSIAKDGISIEDTTKFFIIRGCEISGALKGISIENVTSGTAIITSNYCYNNADNGIDLYLSDGQVISDNRLNENKIGVRFENCSNLVITQNTCNNQRGVGINAFNSHDINITENTFYSSGYEGIMMTNSHSFVVYKNLFELNDMEGILVDSLSADHIFYHNDFIENNLAAATPQAKDHGVNNLWYNDVTLEGNYWSDYSGEGPYTIGGSAGSEDLYPLKKPNIKETNYGLFFILAFISTIFIVIKRRKRN